jgi:hypothetical protein
LDKGTLQEAYMGAGFVFSCFGVWIAYSPRVSLNLRDAIDTRTAFSTLIEVSNDGSWFDLRNVRVTCGLAKRDGFIGTQLALIANSSLPDIEPGQKDTIQDSCPFSTDTSLEDRPVLIVHFKYGLLKDLHRCFDVTPARKPDGTGVSAQHGFRCPSDMKD